MYFIDTHSHLYAQEFSKDILETINRAKKKKVQKIILPNIDTESIEAMFSLAEHDSCFFPTIGLHPTSVDRDFESKLNILEPYLEKERICAVGEIGIDLYWDKTFLNEQIIAFETQIKWAIEKNLPLIIHIRKGFEQAFSSLSKIKNIYPNKKNLYRGVFHCFSGDLNQAKKAIEFGFKIGIGGVITFKNAKLVEIVKDIELKDILLETDAPYLAPTPFRGGRNESSYIPIIAQKIAEIKGVSIEEVGKETTKTAEEVFCT